MKKTIYITSVITLLLLSSYLAYFQTQKYTVWTDNQSGQLKERYAETGNISYLLQLSVIRPEKEHFKLVTYNALRNGNFALANTYNLFADVENYDLLAAESAIMHKDEYFTSKYVSNLTNPQKNEIEQFLSINGTAKTVTINKPITNIGKISEMIVENNFSLHEIDSPLGERISRIAHKYPKKSENNIAVAHYFKDLSYYGISSRITDNIIQDEKCSKEAYLINSESKNLARKHSAALVSLESYLACNPADVEVLGLLTVYAKEASNSQKEELYTNRLKVIEQIK